MPEVLECDGRRGQRRPDTHQSRLLQRFPAKVPKPQTAMAGMVKCHRPWPSGHSARPVAVQGINTRIAPATPSRPADPRHQLLPVTPQKPTQARSSAMVAGAAATTPQHRCDVGEQGDWPDRLATVTSNTSTNTGLRNTRARTPATAAAAAGRAARPTTRRPPRSAPAGPDSVGRPPSERRADQAPYGHAQHRGDRPAEEDEGDPGATPLRPQSAALPEPSLGREHVGRQRRHRPHCQQRFVVQTESRQRVSNNISRDAPTSADFGPPCWSPRRSAAR